MESDNPYQAQVSDRDAIPDAVRLTNINLAGGPLVFAIVVGPAILAASGWYAATNWSAMTADEQGRRLLWLGLYVAVELAALAYAIFVPIWWVEIGPTFRYAKLLKRYEVDWNSVQRIWWDVHHERGPLFIRFATHRALIVRLDDYNDIKVLVAGHLCSRVNAIVSRFRQFRDSPFDEEHADVGPD